ncbi:MAG TPA: universal stress protein [Methylomirabilota bacterium]|nr:universal stress protein [Methylomirabilota bacterium]
MAKRILAPLDVREAHEGIIPVVAALARDSGATVRLLRVFPVPEHVVGPHGRTVAYVDQEMARLTAEGLRDLQRVEAELTGVPVESVVRFGDPAREIVLEAEAFDADLIALGADRQGYVRTALAPGVADRVSYRAPVPTLTLRG